MHDATAVRRGETLGELLAPGGNRLAGHRALRQARAQRLAFEQLRDGKLDAAVLSEVIDGNNIRMCQRRDSSGLALESIAPVLRRGFPAAEDLDGHPSIETEVVRDEHFAHPADSELRNDAITAERGADHRPQ